MDQSQNRMTRPQPASPKVTEMIEADRMRHQRDMLAHAIASAGIRTGGCREDADLTGPQLTMLINDMADRLIEVEQTLSEKQERLDAALAQLGETKNQKVGVAAVPDFDAIKNKRIGDMTAEQFNDATEQWIRDNRGYCNSNEHVDFLLYRLDQSRGLDTPMPQHIQESVTAAKLPSERDVIERKYYELAQQVVKSAEKAGVYDASTADLHQLLHTDLMTLATYTGQAATGKTNPPDSAPAERKPLSEVEGSSTEARLIQRNYDELAGVVTKAAREASFIPTAYRGELKHKETIAMADHIGVVAQRINASNQGHGDNVQRSDNQAVFDKPALDPITLPETHDDDEPSHSPR